MAEATPLKPILGVSTQLGFVVRDLDAALAHWTDVLGVGPFLVLDEGTGRPPGETFHRGEAVRVEIRLGFAYMGEVQIELIQQVNDAASPYREFLEAGREGLQHLGYSVDDHALARQRLEASGYRPIFQIPAAGRPERIIYYESPDLIGPMIEIVPPIWRRAREAVRAFLMANQDGPRLIRMRNYADFLRGAGVRFD